MRLSLTLPLLVLGAAAPSSLFAQAEYLPLETGNYWQYRSPRFGGGFTIRVGTPALIGGSVYYRLTGYVDQPVWVRYENDTLYYRDEERDRDVPLTYFNPSTGGWFEAPLRNCTDEGQPQAKSTDNALHIRYRTFHCADAGIDEEAYRAGVGMIRRSRQSIAGPVVYDLVAARIGRMQLNTDAGAGMRLNIARKPGSSDTMIATLRLTLDTSTTLDTQKPMAQDYDLVLKNANGETLWRWSDGRVFPAAIEFVRLGPGEYSYTVEVPVRGPAGKYTLEGWLTLGTDRIQFAAAMPFEWPLAVTQ